MKCRHLLLPLLLVSHAGWASNDMAEKFEQRYLGWRDFCASINLQIESRSGGERNGQAQVCALRSSDKQGYLRVTVLAPIGAKGTEILSQLQAGAARKQWLYIPATRRATPVNDQRAESPFLGTDLSYVDLGLNLVEPQTMQQTGAGECDGQACLAYDLAPRPGEFRRQVWLMEASGALHHVDIFDGDKPVKLLTVGKEVQSPDGYWLPGSISMQDLRRGSATTMRYSDIRFDLGQTVSDFDPDARYGTGGSRRPGQ